jgi:hypothetical protein
MVADNLDRSLKNTANKPDVARETKYYLENITKVKSVDDFLSNDRLYKFAMKAGGLSDMAYAKAFMRKVLTEGIDKKDSFANSLADPRYKKFAETFNFARYGDEATDFDRAKQGTVDKYVRQTLEEDAGTKSEGARLALYFERMAPNITSAYGILADKALIQFVHTAFQIPDATSLMDIEKQADMLNKKLDIADLKDPEKVKKLINRFTSLYELSNSSNRTVSSAAALFGRQGMGISTDVMSAIQNLKMGGR